MAAGSSKVRAQNLAEAACSREKTSRATGRSAASLTVTAALSSSTGKRSLSLTNRNSGTGWAWARKGRSKMISGSFLNSRLGMPGRR